MCGWGGRVAENGKTWKRDPGMDLSKAYRTPVLNA